MPPPLFPTPCSRDASSAVAQLCAAVRRGAPDRGTGSRRRGKRRKSTRGNVCVVCAVKNPRRSCGGRFGFAFGEKVRLERTLVVTFILVACNRDCQLTRRPPPSVFLYPIASAARRAERSAGRHLTGFERRLLPDTCTSLFPSEKVRAATTMAVEKRCRW